jgi:hypothetical protein
MSVEGTPEDAARTERIEECRKLALYMEGAPKVIETDSPLWREAVAMLNGMADALTAADAHAASLASRVSETERLWKVDHDMALEYAARLEAEVAQHAKVRQRAEAAEASHAALIRERDEWKRFSEQISEKYRSVYTEQEELRTTLVGVISRMRREEARFRIVPRGQEIVGAESVDTWADELEAALSSSPASPEKP